MDQFPGIFLHVEAFNADRLQVGVLSFFSNFNLDPALFSNGLVVLGNLVVLRQVWIEILLAVELAVFSDVEIEGHRRFHRILEHLLIEHREGPRQTTHHRIDVGVGVVTERRGSSRENFAVGSQLHMGFQTDHGFPGGFCCGHDGNSLSDGDPMEAGTQTRKCLEQPDAFGDCDRDR
ncbi:MAG: Uncharacterised protein [Synechococcus sp. CC9902]|nr:MAG: Uncharacterised protein [Synechococcus sp. CC9902]